MGAFDGTGVKSSDGDLGSFGKLHGVRMGSDGNFVDAEAHEDITGSLKGLGKKVDNWIKKAEAGELVDPQKLVDFLSSEMKDLKPSQQGNSVTYSGSLTTPKRCRTRRTHRGRTGQVEALSRIQAQHLLRKT